MAANEIHIWDLLSQKARDPTVIITLARTWWYPIKLIYALFFNVSEMLMYYEQYLMFSSSAGRSEFWEFVVAN